MQMKCIIFLVVVGAVAVLARKDGSEEDESGEFMSAWPYPRPKHGPRPFKFRGPKHQIYVVGRPEYQQQGYYLQRPQFPEGPQRPQNPHFSHRPQESYGPQFSQVSQQQDYDVAEVQQYLENVQRKMQEFAAKAYKEFRTIENEINRNKKEVEDALKSQFQTLELSLEARQEKEIQQAVKDGKDELKIQECLAEEEEDARAEMNADIERTTDCINDATERALKAVNAARNTYTESSFFSSMQARDWAQKVKFCAEQRNSRCVEDGMTLINEKTKNTVQEGEQHFERLEDVPRKQMIQLDYCRQNFKDDLKDMKKAYSQMVKRCVAASEGQETSEDTKEPGKIEMNVEIKPEAEVEV